MLFYRLFVASCLLLVAADIGATTIKYRDQIRDLDGHLVAEHSHIFTLGEDPAYSRVLVHDIKSDRLMVARYTLSRSSMAGPSLSSELVALPNDEVLASIQVDATGQVTLTLCNGVPVSFPDIGGDEYPQGVLDAIGAAHAACNANAQFLLLRIVILGRQYDETLDAMADAVGRWLYPDVPDVSAEAGIPTSLSKDHDFDPAATPPDAFEAQFGAHYYQQ